jgi:hypothetical protein
MLASRFHSESTPPPSPSQYINTHLRFLQGKTQHAA